MLLRIQGLCTFSSVHSAQRGSGNLINVFICIVGFSSKTHLYNTIDKDK